MSEQEIPEKVPEELQDEVFQLTEDWPTWEMWKRLSVVLGILCLTIFGSFFLSALFLL